MEDCLFCKVAGKKIKSDLIYEDDRTVAFRDINPQAPVHVLIVPKKHIPTLLDLKEEDKDIFWHLFSVVNTVARNEKVSDDGFRTLINCRAFGGQTVYHLHIHLLGGRFMRWPPG